jgi:hypothetical protein
VLGGLLDQALRVLAGGVGEKVGVVEHGWLLRWGLTLW